MRTLSIILSILVLFSFTCLADFTVGLELYPEKMDGIFNSKWLHNGKEWFATTVEFDKELFDGLTVGFNIKTYLFGTNGLSYAPSSVKYTNWISYTFNKFEIKYQHYCHHYFHQFENLYSDRDKLVFEYSF